MPGRVFAACIALAAWAGLVVQFAILYRSYPALISLWIMLAFFTITTNLLVVMVFTSIAIDRGMLRSDWIVAGTMLCIVQVGVIYALLLRGALESAGGSALVDRLLHVVTPALVPIYWIFFGHKGGLRWQSPLIWAIYPLAYLGYGITRGRMTGRFAYPFLDVSALGWSRMGVNAFLIAVGFVACGFATVWIDHRIGSIRRRR